MVCAKTRGPIWLGLFLLLCCAVPVLAQQEGVIIRSIEIQGNKRVDNSNILYYIKSKVGEPISRARIRKDIQNIYDLGQFSDIRVETKPAKTDGVRLIFVLEEIPSVGEIEFSGNDTLDVEDLLEEIAIKRGIAFEEHLIQDTIQKLTSLYHEKGYFLVAVKVATKTTPEGLVDVNIAIREGEKIRIQKIRFLGNKALDDGELEDVIETEEESWFSFLDDSGIYKKDVLKIDVLRLEAHYQDQGFLRVRVEDPIIKINKQEKEIYLALKIDEGERYKIQSVKVSGDDTFTQKKLRDMVALKKGDFYNVSQLRKDSLAITELYAERGYAYADVTPKTQIDDKNKTVDVNVVIDKGRKVYVGEINLIGNIKTRDNVIRREFRLKEGDLFNSKKLKRSKARIRNLGFFESVDLDTHRGKTPELIDIDAVVTEQPTGSISFGAGFSSVENMIFTASIAQDNLFGYGQRLSLSTEISDIRTDYDLRFTEPRIFDSARGNGGKGANLAQPRLRRASDDQALSNIIRRGIRGTEMPGSPLTPSQVSKIAAYVKTLGRVDPEDIPGDRSRGEAVYAGLDCARCHTRRGRGGIVGPDLDDIGARRSAVYLREALLAPEASVPSGFLQLKVVTQDGRNFTGIRVNEDGFSVQFWDLSGRLYSFWKDELDVFERQWQRSPMTSYDARLTSEQTDDLVAYLVSLKGAP